MARVIIFSREFPAYHPKSGMPTYFIERFLTSLNFQTSNIPEDVSNIMDTFGYFCGYIPKYHTIRHGNRFKAGDKFSPRVWSGKPYRSKMIILAPDVKIKKTWDFKITCERNSEMPGDISNFIYINDKLLMWNDYETVAKNDGLGLDDFLYWFRLEGDGEECKPQSFSGQIICWNDNINY